MGRSADGGQTFLNVRSHTVGGLAWWQRRSSDERSYSTLNPVSTGMGDRLRALHTLVILVTYGRSTNPYIPPGSLNRVPASIDWDKGGNVTSAGWQVTLRSHIAREFL